MAEADADADADAWLEWLGHGSYANARKLLRPDQDVNVRGAQGMTGLHVAAQIGSLEKIQRLLTDGADPRLTNDQGKTPLHYAQYESHAEVAYTLVECDEMVRALARKLDRTPSHHEIHTMVTEKTPRDFRQNVKRNLANQTAKFLFAARQGDLRTVQSMVLYGEIPIDAVDKSTGETAFSIALAGGRRRMYEFLMQKGAHAYGLCVVNGQPVSMLSVAVARSDVDLVRQLVAYGARVSTPKFEQITCVLAQAMETASMEMVEVLIALGARFDWSSIAGSLPWRLWVALGEAPLAPWQLLYYACWQETKRPVEQLIGACEEPQDREMVAVRGRAVFLAAYRGNNVLATELLARGAPVTVGALYGAIHNDTVRMLQVFLDHHDDASIVQGSLEEFSLQDQSLLVVAVKNHAVECVKLLLPLETRAGQRHIALMFAMREGNYEIADCLLDQVLPATEPAFLKCLRVTKCPLVLDLLLTRCCSEPFLCQSLSVVFPDPPAVQGAALLAVFLAHGIGFDIANIYWQ